MYQNGLTLALKFFSHLDYVAKTRKSNVSRNKPEFNKVILVSISNFINQKKPISSSICICFCIFAANDTTSILYFCGNVNYEAAAVGGKAIGKQQAPCYSHPRLLIISPYPDPHTSRADLAPVPKIIYQADPSLVPGVQLFMPGTRSHS